MYNMFNNKLKSDGVIVSVSMHQTRENYCFSAGSSVLISGYSSFTPGSHSNFGQQYGNGADLLVLSESNLQRSLAIGNGPQSSTDSKRLQNIDKKNINN